MTQELDDLFAELDSAKADLARSVKRCRTFFGDRKLPPVTVEGAEAEKSAFSWGRRSQG
jgi:hypothetical protein